MSGSHYANAPAPRGALFDDAPTLPPHLAADGWRMPPHIDTHDCSAWPEQAKARIAALEARISALEGVVAHHADVVQVLVLRVEELERAR